ncbi:MAG TPA: invasion associated locus B family protein [Bauldia sp.]|nr:invasion associated locus B family protein [Bauldia sp.]
MNVNGLIAAAAFLLGATSLALAASPSPIGSFKQWSAYTSNEADGKMCFIASQPTDTKTSQPISSRDPVFFMITVIPAKKIVNEASTIIGYAFKEGSKVTVDVDGTKFTMFTDKDSAWVENPADEPQLVAAMKGGSKMTVQGTSRRGTVTTDSYSLSGISAALDAIAKACPTAQATQ